MAALHLACYVSLASSSHGCLHLATSDLDTRFAVTSDLDTGFASFTHSRDLSVLPRTEGFRPIQAMEFSMGRGTNCCSYYRLVTQVGIKLLATAAVVDGSLVPDGRKGADELT
ncbi:hypothetical protein ACP4OV_027383 [Aristida adscensionis]